MAEPKRCFAEGVDFQGVGTIGPRLRLAILSVDQPGDVAASAVMLQSEPYVSDDSLPQKQPRVAVTGDTFALLWQQSSPDASSADEEVILVTWRWDGAQEQLVLQREQPAHETSTGRQTIPALEGLLWPFTNLTSYNLSASPFARSAPLAASKRGSEA